MKFRAPKTTKRARIEIIPLIDVIFFLLATFVLVSLSMTRLQAINIELPKGKLADRNLPPPETVTVYITDSGGYLWNTIPMTYEQVLTKLRQYKRDTPDPIILINGDENSDWVNAVNILDAARKEKIEKVSIETKLKKKPVLY